MEDEKVVISSLVVEARPESVDAVARALAAMEGVEVHEVNGYKIVVTIEA
ncbi:MAG: chaperone NapD, partial [Adlercreutzia sp.]|nr:chaperone NapD [Adlercreutzia sp.]